MRDRLKTGAPIAHLALGVAGWMRYVAGLDEMGGAIDVRDPMAVRLRACADHAGLNAETLVSALLGIPEIFGSDLPQDTRFTGALTHALETLLAKGAARTVQEFSQ